MTMSRGLYVCNPLQLPRFAIVGLNGYWPVIVLLLYVSVEIPAPELSKHNAP